MKIIQRLTEGIRAFSEGRFADAEVSALAVLQEDARNARALNLLGMSLVQQGRVADGRAHVEAAAVIDASYAQAHGNLAAIDRGLGDSEAALRHLERAIAAAPGDADFFLGRGAILLELGRPAEAIESFSRSIELEPESADAYLGLADAHALAGTVAKAVEAYEKSLALNGFNAEAYNNRANCLRKLDRAADALADYERAIELRPDFSEAFNNRGNALKDLARDTEALASYEHALLLRPAYPEALNNRGLLLCGLGRIDEALACYDQAIALNPTYVDAYNSRGILFGELRQQERALADFDAALALRPDYARAWSNRGNALRQLDRLDEAVESFDRALALDTRLSEAHFSRAHALRDLRRHADSVAGYARLVECAPGYAFARGHLLHAKMLCCDWDGVADLAAVVQADVRAGRRSAEPFGYQGIAESVNDLRTCAEIYAAAMYPPRVGDFPPRARGSVEKIRLGYLCGEFRQQATAVLMVELFERHDKSRFELVAFDNGWDDRSPMRARIERAFDEIVDISQLGDRQAAQAIHSRGIDILVNLNGYFGLQRQGVFALKPAPLQINYLGFPGTLGASYMDYILADRCVIPPDERDAYVEQVVYLPDCYQANDSKRPIAAHSGSRSDHGLPEDGFVFCCFNNNYKITPEIFGIWMRLLERIAGSVLWLLEDNADAARNLREEAARRGIDPRRLVFAPRMTAAEHLARHRHADLFLDTLPYNAHTTASDALWAGLPLLTCRGTTFPGRVAASLLQAAGMPDLITENLADYERTAVTLAIEPARLAELRARLADNRSTCRLYDSNRFCRNIEQAFQEMWRRFQHGEPVSAFPER